MGQLSKIVVLIKSKQVFLKTGGPLPNCLACKSTSLHLITR